MKYLIGLILYLTNNLIPTIVVAAIEPSFAFSII